MRGIIGTVDENTSATERASTQAVIRECDRKLDRYRTLLETGTDAALIAQWIREVQTERRRAQAILDAAAQRNTDGLVTAAEVREIVLQLGGLVGLLDVSGPKFRSGFYEAVGLSGTYDPFPDRSTPSRTLVSVRFVSEGGLETPAGGVPWSVVLFA